MYRMDILSNGTRLINERINAAVDSLAGYIYCNPTIGLLDFGRVVVRRDYAAIEGVKIVSGGESGLNPAHCGFVGSGMLTAAIYGDVFCSPSVCDILKTVGVLTYQRNNGILLIVQNTPGYRLNFGLALERARNEGIRIKMLVVADNCNITSKIKGRRGLSGVVLIQKIAGAMAEERATLDEIYKFCKEVSQELSTALLCAKSSPALETCVCTRHLGSSEMEIGAGLHGDTAKNACRSLLVEITQNSENPLKLDSSVPVVVLVNNLGAISKLEESIFVKEVVQILHSREIPVSRVYCGSFLTSLDIAGLSVTIMRILDLKTLNYLDAPCITMSWPKPYCIDVTSDLLTPLPLRIKEKRSKEYDKGPKLSERQSNIVRLVVQFACDALISCEKQLNLIDSESGNANTGTRLRRGAESIIEAVSSGTLEFLHPLVFLEALSKLVEESMGGTLGCIYSIMFDAGSKVFRNMAAKDGVDARIWLLSLDAASNAIKRYGNVDLGDHTMYDPLYACAAVMEIGLKRSDKCVEIFGSAVAEAEDAAVRTKEPHKRYPDAGAHAVGIWMRAVYEGVKISYIE